MMTNQYPSNWPLKNSSHLPEDEIPTPILEFPIRSACSYTDSSYHFDPPSAEEEISVSRAGSATDDSGSMYSQSTGQFFDPRSRCTSSYYDDSGFLSCWTDPFPGETETINSINTASISSSDGLSNKGGGNSTCNIEGFCNDLINDYQHLVPGSTPDPNTRMNQFPESPGKDKPLPALPYSFSTSTLSPSDFAHSSADDDKENAQRNVHTIIRPPLCPSDPDPSRSDGGPALPLPIPWDVGTQEALKALELHMQSRMPAVKAASVTLQKNIGLYGHEMKQPQEFGPLLQAGVGGNFQDVTGKPRVKMARWGDRTELREALLMHGMQPYGQQKRTPMSSISFHDVTPDENGAFQNELLAHYDSDGKDSTKLVLYEVNVPLPTPPHLAPRVERWLHFLISMPFLPYPPSNLDPSVYLPGDPIPASWLIFAIPINSINIYPSVPEATSPSKGWGPKKTMTRQDFEFGDGCGIHHIPPNGERLHNGAYGNGTLGTGLSGLAVGGRDNAALSSFACKKDVVFEFMDKLRGIDTVPNWRPESHDSAGNVKFERQVEFAKVLRILQEDNPKLNFLSIPAVTGSSPVSCVSSGNRGSKEPASLRDRTGILFSSSKQVAMGEVQGPHGGSQFYVEMVQQVREDGAKWARIRDAMTSGRCRVICRTESGEKENGLKMVLRSASRRIGRTKLSQEVSR